MHYMIIKIKSNTYWLGMSKEPYMQQKDMHAYLNLGRCIFCCQCVDTCPKKSLGFSSDVLLANFRRENLKIEL